MARQSEPSDLDPEKIPDVAVSRELKHAHMILAKRFLALQKDYEEKFPLRKIIITCSYRSPREQQRLYAQGRTAPGGIVTQADGVRKLSKHNAWPARALDTAILQGGKIEWAEELYWPYIDLCKKHGLIAGGSWIKFPDWCHVQLPDDVV